MKRGIILTLVISLGLCISFSTANFTTMTVKAPNGYPVHNLNTSLNYTSIQGAIDASETLNGHTLFVETGVYYEHLVLTKSLILLGEEQETTIIDGDGENRTIIEVTAGNVVISGFSIRNSSRVAGTSYAGIKVSSFACNITGNFITRTKIGIFVISQGSRITENVVRNSGQGIALYSSHDVIVEANDLLANTVGISLALSSNNMIANNRVMNSSTGGHGITLSSDSFNNTIRVNELMHNYHGMWLSSSSDNSILENTIANNKLLGIELASSLDNTFHHNNFVNNGIQPFAPAIKHILSSQSTSVWDDGYPSGGNYWNEYNGSDADNDGVGDIAYTIDESNNDNYPLMGMFSSFNATSEHNVQTICNSTISEFQHNGTAISFDVTGENGSVGFCRICIPTDLMSEYQVFVNGTEVDYNLLPVSNSTHSYLYFTYQHSTREVVIIPEFSLLTLQSDMPVVHVDPQNIEANISETFTIYLKIFNLSNNFHVTDERWEYGEPLGPPGVRHNYSLGGLFGLDIQLHWDPTVLEYVEHTVTMPVETYPEGLLHAEPELVDVKDEVDAEAGTYWLAKASQPPADAFNNPEASSTAFNMTFTVLKRGVSELNITSSDLVIPLSYLEYIEANAEIPHWRVNGFFKTPELATRIASLDVKPLDNGTFFTQPVITGENAFITSTIINDGNLTDTYNLTLHWGPTLLNSWMNETLQLGAQKSYNHTVNGAELSIGNHTITATISVSHNTSTYIEEMVKQFRVIGKPTLTILGPFSAEPGDTIYYTTNSTHTDPEGEIISYNWALWGHGDYFPRAYQTGENATFEIDPSWMGSYIVTLDIEENYGVEYNESRPASHAWHAEKSIEIIPEIPSLVLLPLFMLCTLLATVFYRRRKTKVST